MSRHYYLINEEGKEYVWIGQCPPAKPEEFYLYLDDKEVMEKLAKFLLKYQGKELKFVDEHYEGDGFLDDTYNEFKLIKEVNMEWNGN